MNIQPVFELKRLLKETAFLVAEKAPSNQVHAKIVDCLVLAAKITDESINAPPHRTDSDSYIASASGQNKKETEEINQVRRRLPRWKNNPQQINSRILAAFLELRNKGSNEITQEQIKEKFNGDIDKFDGNFSQMINFGAQNHGKVFERNGAFIEIWEPVKEAVARFENS